MTSHFSGDPDPVNINGTSARSSAKTDALGHTARWLLVWFAIALVIRLMNLTAKGAWMDEVATTLFSLGNYSRLIPLNEIISLDQILLPLQITPGATAGDVIHYLLLEDNHPPTYFVLAHWWMGVFQKIFGSTDGYASLWASRSLSAVFGALAVPATYLLAWISFKDRLISLLCAALMAVSPFSVFLSQEARHYTLAILAVIASLCCFAAVTQKLQKRQAPNWGTVLAWGVINTLGLTVHFFFGLTLVAEGMTLLVLLVQQCRIQKNSWRTAPWARLYVAMAGTLAGCLVWLPILANFYGSPQTSFLRSEVRNWQFWVNPIVQSLAGWLYAILSPVTKGIGWLPVTAIIVTCVSLLLIYTPWLISVLQRSLRFQLQQPPLRAGIQAIGGFFILANVLFLAICYGPGFDITRGHRYSFVFFPSILLLVGVSLAPFWPSGWQNGRQSSTQAFSSSAPDQGQKQFEAVQFGAVKLPFTKRTIPGRRFVALVLGVGFLGTQCMVNDLTSLKFYDPKAFINFIQAESSEPVIIGTATTITEQPSVVGIEIMSAAWEIQRNFHPEESSQPSSSGWTQPPRFIITANNAAENTQADVEMIQSLEKESLPFDLWLLGFNTDLTSLGCQLPAENSAGNQGSFNYTHYLCEPSN